MNIKSLLPSMSFSVMLPRVLEFSGNVEEVASGCTVCCVD